jgi:hypothetical protein
MSPFDWFQLVVDVVFLFLILVFLLGRGWRRGAAAEERESYREMVTRLSSLIGEMKDTSADLQERIGEKQLEVQQAISVADDRIRRMKDLAAAPGPRPAPAPGSTSVSGPPPAPFSARPAPPQSPAAPPDEGLAESDPVAARAEASAAEPAPAPAPRDGMDDEDRREKYRQALDFAQKGWNALDIARFTQLPRGEVELLMRTKGKQV